MCPACLTTLLLTAGATGSAGGLVALAIKKAKDRPRPTASNPPQNETRTPEKTR